MTTATAEPLTKIAIDQFLAQLTEQQRKYVFIKLSGPILEPIKEKRAFLDEKGNLLGDYVPIPRVQPGQKVGMSDEARVAMAGMVFKTRAQWEADRAAQANSEEEKK